VEYAVLDWCILGLHTGSRLSEYGQSKRRKGELFAIAPLDSNAGRWAGQPIAFTRADLTFYDNGHVFRRYQACLGSPILAGFLHVRFRFDKSANNFTTRKFQRQPNSIFCPINAALSILRHADMLGIPNDYPIGTYRALGSAPGSFAFITGDDVSRVMQTACVLAYPNPDHYLRRHIHLLQSHSNRITAAVALFNANVPIPTIAHRLRWSEESVKFYLRDCFKAVGPLTQKAILGSQLN
jgi:hypothetical protein